MTHVLVKKNGDLKDGMVDAGEYINEWMKTHGPSDKHQNFFDDLWDNLEGSDNREFFVKDGADKKLSKNGNKYEYAGGELKPKPDKNFGIGSDKNMTIAIPEKNANMLSTYMGTIVTHVKDLADDEARKYLLAVIFLNRCQ